MQVKYRAFYSFYRDVCRRRHFASDSVFFCVLVEGRTDCGNIGGLSAGDAGAEEDQTPQLHPFHWLHHFSGGTQYFLYFNFFDS